MRSPATLERGTGPAVLLVHGLNGFKEGWGELPGALAAAGMRAVAVDLPGFGATPRLRRTTPRAMAEELAPLVDSLAPAGIVAHSLGAQVALLAAAAYPERVGRLALLAPWVVARPRRFPPVAISDVLQTPLIGRPLARLLIARARRDPERRRRAFLATAGDPEAVTRDPAQAALLEAAGERLARADLRAMADWAASAMGLDVLPAATRVRGPALVVAGTLDRVTKPAGARALAAALPAARLISLPGVGHFPYLEAPGAVIPAVVDHLAGR